MTACTYSFALLPVSNVAYEEVLRLLVAAGYRDHDDDDEPIDMHGLALVRRDHD